MSCPECFSGSVHNHLGEAKGAIETLHGLECYIALPPTPSSSNPPATKRPPSTIIYLTDGFGLSLINNLILCDQLAASTGLRVLAPAYLPSTPLSVAVMPLMDDLLTTKIPWWNLWAQLIRIVLVIRILALGLPFTICCRFPKGHVIALAFARAVRRDLEPGAKLGVAGFCWGGYSATLLCGETAVDGGDRSGSGNDDGGKRLIDASFVGHPSGLKVPRMIVDAVSTFHTPYSMAIGDRDMLVGEQKALEVEAQLRRSLETEGLGEGKAESGRKALSEDEDPGAYQVQIYKGCSHGFVVRAAPNNPAEVKGMHEAREQAVRWFNKYL